MCRYTVEVHNSNLSDELEYFMEKYQEDNKENTSYHHRRESDLRVSFTMNFTIILLKKSTFRNSYLTSINVIIFTIVKLVYNYVNFLTISAFTQEEWDRLKELHSKQCYKIDNVNTQKRLWNFWSSLDFCATVLTTIGQIY